jgi:hypothetical protein
VVAEDTTTGGRYILLVRVQDDSVILLHEPMELGILPEPDLRWLSLDRDGLNGVVMSIFDPFEAVGTGIFELENDTLRRIYADGNICQPAELRDVDGDWQLELVSYVEDPLDGQDCAHFCHIDLWGRFHMMPAWVRIQQWNGEEWVSVERKLPIYYRGLARRYQMMDRWLREGPGNERCLMASWVQERPTFFSDLAARALEIAGEGAPPPDSGQQEALAADSAAMALVEEYLSRDARGEFTRVSEWLREFAPYAMNYGWDAMSIISGYKILGAEM